MVLIPPLGCQPPTKPRLLKAPLLLRFYQTMGQISSVCNVNSDPNHSKTKIELMVGVYWSCPCSPAFFFFFFNTQFYISSVKILSEHPFRMCLRSHHGVWWFLWNSLLTGTIHCITWFLWRMATPRLRTCLRQSYIFASRISVLWKPDLWKSISGSAPTL